MSTFAMQSSKGLSFGTGPPELWSSWKDHTDPRMSNMDKERKLQSPSSNGSAGGQEEDAVHFKSRKQRLFSACSEHKRVLIGIVISHLILSSAFFGLGTLLPLNCQRDASKCPSDWIAYQEHCYRFSREEKNWKESQNFCILHNASLAKITEEEMDFVTKLTGNQVFWIGLKSEQDQPWKWPDGENAKLEVLGNGADCAFLNDGKAYSGRCSTEHHYICKKN